MVPQLQVISGSGSLGFFGGRKEGDHSRIFVELRCRRLFGDGGLRMGAGKRDVRMHFARRCGSQVLEFAHSGGRFAQCAFEGPRALHQCFAPCIFLHALFGLHPRAGGLAPAAGCSHGHFEVETVGFSGGVSPRGLPLRRHPDHRLVDEERSAHVAIEHLHSTNADAVHPLEVSGDAGFGDIAAHPVPPGARLGAVRRRAELLFERRRCRLGVSERIDGDENCRGCQPGKYRMRSLHEPPRCLKWNGSASRNCSPNETIYGLKTLCNAEGDCQRAARPAFRPCRSTYLPASRWARAPLFSGAGSIHDQAEGKGRLIGWGLREFDVEAVVLLSEGQFV